MGATHRCQRSSVVHPPYNRNNGLAGEVPALGTEAGGRQPRWPLHGLAALSITEQTIIASIKGEHHEPIHLLPAAQQGNEAARPGTPGAGAAGRPHGAFQLHGVDRQATDHRHQHANAAAGPNTIKLVAGKTFTLTSPDATNASNGLPAITNGNLTIKGNGDTISRSTAAGTPAFRLFDVASGASLSLKDLTLSNGLVIGDTGAEADGGAILVEAGAP